MLGRRTPLLCLLLVLAPGFLPAAPSGPLPWALTPPTRHPPPAVKNSAWCRTLIDQFILARLEAEGLEPSPQADRRTLLRRLSFDLTGLPPTFEECEAFAADEAPGAVERVVDRLLASPHHGERWGRHWLDVARYADTKGYVYGDREERRFVHAHVYRDWVVRSLNEDRPYDELLVLQIAADQAGPGGLPAPPEDLAAMGFLTVGRRFLGVIHDIIDDRIDTLMRGTQALTASCARCHDHKFDPIPTRDYYSLYSIFQGSSEVMAPLAASEPTPAGRAYEEELARRQKALEERFARRRGELEERLRARTGDYLLQTLNIEELPSEEFYAFLAPEDLNPVIARQWHTHLFRAGQRGDPVFLPWITLAALDRAALERGEASSRLEALEGKANRVVLDALRARRPTSMAQAAEVYQAVFARAEEARKAAASPTEAGGSAAPGPSVADPALEALGLVLHGPDSPARVPPGPIVEVEWLFDEATRVELGKLSASVEAWKVESPGAPPHAVYLVDRPVQPTTRVFLRGNPALRGEAAPRRYLEVLSPGGSAPFEHGSGRLELARAIASPRNPLTARVVVNRVWQHHFGAGLVRTPSDFGKRAEPPTHPELLDDLAVRFVEEGWSLKRLHREIVLSSVYQQSSVPPSRARTVDPENRLLSHHTRSRLELEPFRDALLAAAGQLDLTMGGPPVKIFDPPHVRRRTIYGEVDRQFVPGALRAFDFANPDQHTAERHETTVPQQALYLLNGPIAAECARWALRRQDLPPASAPAERLVTLYRTILQRNPTDAELSAGLQYIAAAEREPRDEPPPGANEWQYGHGSVDEALGRLKAFVQLPHFTGEAWQGGPAWPDGKLGWVQLTAQGGHSGNDLEHAAVRRWTAPRAGKLNIGGVLKHTHGEGDGIHARILSSRSGVLGEWSAHNASFDTATAETVVDAGETIDFVVDQGKSLGYDDFTWTVEVHLGDARWESERGFQGPMELRLSAWEEYAQVLLLSNELAFVD